jgi:hypothetical protein
MASRTVTRSPASVLVQQVKLQAQKHVGEQVRANQTSHMSRMYVYEFLHFFMKECGHTLSALQKERMDQLEDEVLDTYLDPAMVHAYASVHGFLHDDGTINETAVNAHITQVIDAEKQKMLQEIRFKIGREKCCIVCLKRTEQHLYKCSRCYCTYARYCSTACQRVDWPLHKAFCDDLKAVMQSAPTPVTDRFNKIYTLNE